MNFQFISPVKRSKELLDLAFGKAREKSDKKLEGEWLDRIKRKEATRLDVTKENLVSSLNKIVKDFPSLDHLPEFYIKLLKLTLDYVALKQSLGSLDWASGRVKFFHKNYVKKISRCQDIKQMRSLRKEFYGRVSSIIKQIDKELFFLDECRKIMKKYPDIKEVPTVVIFGFPNVGKTTLLNKLTGAKGKIAGYSFTTKGVNSGFLEVGNKKIQFLDVPGTLDRLDKMNDIEKIANLTVKELADIIIYVFDISGVGYGLKKQEQLFRNLKSNFGQNKKVLIYLSKQDIVEKDKIQEFGKKYSFLDIKTIKTTIKKLI